MLHAIVTSFYKYFSRHTYIQQYQNLYTFHIGSHINLKTCYVRLLKNYSISQNKRFFCLRKYFYIFAYVNIIGNAKQIS